MLNKIKLFHVGQDPEPDLVPKLIAVFISLDAFSNSLHQLQIKMQIVNSGQTLP